MSDDLIERLKTFALVTNEEVLLELGWTRHYERRSSKETWNTSILNPLTSVDDALKLIPEDWFVSSIRQHEDTWIVTLETGDFEKRTVESVSSTLPRAITAVALRANEADNAKGEQR